MLQNIEDAITLLITLNVKARVETLVAGGATIDEIKPHLSAIFGEVRKAQRQSFVPIRDQLGGADMSAEEVDNLAERLGEDSVFLLRQLRGGKMECSNAIH